MKQLTSLVFLMGATTLAAAQSSPPPTGSDPNHASPPAATAPAAPASPATAPTPSPQPTASKDTPASAAAVSSTDKKDDFKIPRGYKRVVRDGEERFCRSELVAGSLAHRREVCLTQAQLEAEQRGSQDFIQNVQRSGGTATYSTPMGAGGMGR